VEKRLKHGSRAHVLPLDDSVCARDLADPRGGDPDALLDQAWASEVIRRALDRVREHCTTEKRLLQWRVFEAYDLAKADRPTYGEVASQLGIKPTDVHNHLFVIREKVREAIWEELRDTVASEGDVKREWDVLFRA